MSGAMAARAASMAAKSYARCIAYVLCDHPHIVAEFDAGEAVATSTHEVRRPPSPVVGPRGP